MPDLEYRRFMVEYWFFINRVMLGRSEKRYFDYIKKYQGVHVSSIAYDFDLSTEAVSVALLRMLRKGWLYRERHPGDPGYYYWVKDDLHHWNQFIIDNWSRVICDRFMRKRYPLLRYVRTHPGLYADQIAHGLREDEYSTRQRLHYLKKKGWLKSYRGNRTAMYSNAHVYYSVV